MNIPHKTSLIVGLAVAALAQTASAAPASDASDRTNLIQPAIEYPGGYPQSGRGYLGPTSAAAAVVVSDSEIQYPGGYPQSGRGYLGHPRAH